VKGRLHPGADEDLAEAVHHYVRTVNHRDTESTERLGGSLALQSLSL